MKIVPLLFSSSKYNNYICIEFKTNLLKFEIMKTIIQSPLFQLNDEIALEFVYLLNNIQLFNSSESELRGSFKHLNFKHFAFGFGGHHMWVKQIIDNQPKQQVIFVEF